MSSQIRWSLDLRWQRPNEPNGFYGLKDCITMAKADDPSFKVLASTSENIFKLVTGTANRLVQI